MTTIALSPTTDNVAPITSPFTKNLQELLEDGIYLLFLLRNNNAPNSLAEFNKRVDQFLDQFEANARNLGKPPAAVSDAKYAFCALMDEIILSSDFPIRPWQRSRTGRPCERAAPNSKNPPEPERCYARRAAGCA